MEIKRIIIWGLKKRWHTHRFIHQRFFDNAKKLGYKVVWVEDEKENAKFVNPGDLVIFSEVQGRMVPEKKVFEDYNLPIIEGTYYCLHNVKEIFYKNIKKKYLLHLEKYQNDFDNLDGNEVWRTAVYFNLKNQTLYQPWGTNLLYYEFKKPVYNTHKFIFWIGSIWDNALRQGNLRKIQEFKKILEKNNLKFIHLRFIPDFFSVFFTRLSRIAPAIVGEWQEEHDYLPCRMFQNISYGQVGFSNVKKFQDIFGEYNISGSIEEMTNKVLNLNKEEYEKLVLNQQEIVKNYTYKDSLENIFLALDNISKKYE
jgi:hypothetical protein